MAAARSAEFVTVSPDGFPVANLLPITWEGGTVIAHMARANPQWSVITADSPALLICSGPDAYISPSWYAAKGRTRPCGPDVELQRCASVRDGEGARGPRLVA